MASISSTRFSRTQLIKFAIAISIITIISNIAEGALSMFFGQQTRSVSLLIFGIASFVETASSILVLWRFITEIRQNIVKVSVSTISATSTSSASTSFSHLEKEQKLIEFERKGVLGIGGLFIILALGALSHSIITLTQKSHPANTTAGLIISSFSIVFMLMVYAFKRYLAIKLNSSTMLNDSQCSLACIKITAVLFCSSLIYLIWAELWWTDSVATLLFSIFFAKEGCEMITCAKDKNFTGGYSSQIATNGERQGSNCKTDEESEIGTNKEKGRHLRVSVNDDEQVEESTSIGGAWWRENGTDIELEHLAKSVKYGTETSFSIAIVAH
ncbi:3694_t:CDS:1 [Racocetra persica]|uniref:3694_t:CDS:1 n=1 Tax=Racocetra persica TaxID=160502 RepID=A0ACA9RFI6_9GLOM|nr:3694_t:CDS:1 [Racocetra persica]